MIGGMTGGYKMTLLCFPRLEFEKLKTRLNIQLEYSHNQLKKKMNKVSALKETIIKDSSDIENLKEVVALPTDPMPWKEGGLVTGLIPKSVLVLFGKGPEFQWPSGHLI